MVRRPAAPRPPAADEAADAPDFILEDFLPHRLSVVSARAHRLFARAYAERAGLSVAEWRVLSVLARSGDASATDVARHSAMDKGKVSRAVRSLLERRLLRRTEDRRDRRIRRLAITAGGRRTHAAMVPLAHPYRFLPQDGYVPFGPRPRRLTGWPSPTGKTTGSPPRPARF